MYKSLKLLVATSSIATLVACGGGGGGSTATAPVAAPSTTTFPVKAAATNIFKNSSSQAFRISGTSSSVAISGSGTVTRGTPISGIFEGAAVLTKTSTLTGTVVVGANSVPLASVSRSFADSNYNPLGYSSDEGYAVITGVVNLPTSAAINDTGTMYTANIYTDSSKSVRKGTETVSFAMQPDTSTTGLLKIINVSKNVSGTTTLTSTLTIRIDASGAITYLSEAATYPNGDSLTLTY